VPPINQRLALSLVDCKSRKYSRNPNSLHHPAAHPLLAERSRAAAEHHRKSKENRIDVVSREKWCERAAHGGIPAHANAIFAKMFEFMG